jgi:hypothetical protein
MTRFRNRLLILLALLSVGLLGGRGVARATNLQDWDPLAGSFTGEPDTPSVKKTSASIAPGDDSVPTISRTLWLEWAGRIWAAVNLGLGR